MSSTHDFSGLYLDFHKCPKDQSLCSFFPELNAFKEFTKADSDDDIKVAILIGDPDSPFVRIKDRPTMVRAVLDHLKIPVETEEEKTYFDNIVNYRELSVAGCWIRYVQIMHNTLFTDWVMAQKTYNLVLFELNKDEGIELNKRLTLQKELRTLGASLREIEGLVFLDSKAAQEAALLEVTKISLYAERYAEGYTHI